MAEITDSNVCEEQIPDKSTQAVVALMRFFSVDSEMNIPSAQTAPEFPHSLCCKEFILKILELLIGGACAGVYSEAVAVMKDSIISMTFPNVVFSSFIIITSVIIMSYMLGYRMPAVLIRIFNSLATILYFTSASVTLHRWLQRKQTDDAHLLAWKLLLTQSIISYINFIVYAIDVFYSIKKAIVL